MIMKSRPKKSEKKTYQPPKVTDYGDVRNITKSSGTTSTVADKPGGGTNKTH